MVDREARRKIDELEAIVADLEHLRTIEMALPLEKQEVKGSGGSLLVSLNSGLQGTDDDIIIPCRLVTGILRNGKYDANLLIRDTFTETYSLGDAIWAIDVAKSTALVAGQDFIVNPNRDDQGNLVSEVGGGFYVALKNNTATSLSTSLAWALTADDPTALVEWTAGFWPFGTLRTYLGSTYIQRNTVPSDGTPGVSSDWLLMSVLNTQGAYNGQFPYSAGDYVQESRRLYSIQSSLSSSTTICLVDCEGQSWCVTVLDKQPGPCTSGSGSGSGSTLQYIEITCGDTTITMPSQLCLNIKDIADYGTPPGTSVGCTSVYDGPLTLEFAGTIPSPPAPWDTFAGSPVVATTYQWIGQRGVIGESGCGIYFKLAIWCFNYTGSPEIKVVLFGSFYYLGGGENINNGGDAFLLPITFPATYSSGITYVENDLVSLSGVVYINSGTSTGVSPPTAPWLTTDLTGAYILGEPTMLQFATVDDTTVQAGEYIITSGACAEPPVVYFTHNAYCDDATTILLTGSGFLPTGNTVTLSPVGTVSMATFVDSHTLSLTVSSLSAGPLFATVTNSNGSSGIAVQIALISASPTVTLNTGNVSQASFGTFTFFGTGFTAGTVTMSSGTYSVSSITTTSVTMNFSVAPSLGSLTADVETACGDSGAIEVANVVASAAPTVTMDTDQACQNASIEIMGTNFTFPGSSNSVVLSSGTVTGVSFASPTELDVSFTGASIGSLTAVVSNVNGTSGSAVQVATIVSTGAATFDDSGTQSLPATTLDITGTNFYAPMTVTLSSGSATVAVTSSTTATLTFTSQPSVGALDVVSYTNLCGGIAGLTEQIATMASCTVAPANPCSAATCFMTFGVNYGPFAMTPFGGHSFIIAVTPGSTISVTYSNAGGVAFLQLIVLQDDCSGSQLTNQPLDGCYNVVIPMGVTTIIVQFNDQGFASYNYSFRVDNAPC